MTITTAFNDLIHSVYELFASFFGAIYSIVSSIVLAVGNLFRDFFNLVSSVFGGLVDLVGGIGKFIFGNIVLIGVVAAAGFFYVNYQKQQGRRVTAPAVAKN